jgi:hypothetical protein
MDSIKTKSNDYSRINGKAIAGIVLIPEKGQFRAYVAWEWEDQAIQGNFAIIESQTLIDKENIAETINNIADYGNDVTHKKEIQKLFGKLF